MRTRASGRSLYEHFRLSDLSGVNPSLPDLVLREISLAL